MSSTTPPAHEGRYTQPKLAAALAEICAAVGLDSGGAHLIRFVSNSVFLLRDHPVVVRIVPSPSLSYRAINVVNAARWLAEHDIPAVRLLPGIEQPVQAGEHLATLWEAVPEIGPPPSGHDLGELLRKIHALPVPPTFRAWDPMSELRRSLRDAEALAPDDRRFLQRRCEDVECRLAELRFPLPTSVVHGDAHLGNLISGPHGPVLCDLDSLCVGPPEWDLTPAAVGWKRMGHSAQSYRQLADSYGFDVTQWSGFEVLRDLRELRITAGAVPIMRSRPGIGVELHRRLQSMRSGDVTAQWVPYN
jgi:aminoglycoside phosphotransferase (APT) family kinase protein